MAVSDSLNHCVSTRNATVVSKEMTTVQKVNMSDIHGSQDSLVVQLDVGATLVRTSISTSTT
jgi:hypothetical protein